MEARLFALSMWCGVYGAIIRFVNKRDELAETRWAIAAIDSLFWGTFAVMGGMLLASYTEQIEQSLHYALIFGGAGLIVGAIMGFWKSQQRNEREELLRDNLEWADTGFSAILLASVVMFFVVQAFKIPSGSMRMTLIEGDHLFVNKFVYGVPVPLSEKKVVPMHHVAVGDIVIFRFPAPNKESPHWGKDFIKRTVALEGQEVKVVDKHVFVDGVERKEPFKQHVEAAVYPGLEGMTREAYQKAWETGEFAKFAGNDVRDNFGPVTVPPGCIFVMGDNRDRSFDSRFWGPLKTSAIKGKAWVLYWPLSRFRLVK